MSRTSITTVQPTPYLAGQTCVRPDYCMVQESVADAFIAQLKASTSRMYSEKPQVPRYHPSPPLVLFILVLCSISACKYVFVRRVSLSGE